MGLRSAALFLAALIGGAVPESASATTLAPGTTSIQETVDVGGYDAHVLYIKKRGPQAQGTQAPLLVLLHVGATARDRDASLASASRLARDTGAWVLLLDSIDTGLSKARGGERTAVLSRLIDRTLSRYPVDADRVYLAGFSGGAEDALRFLCEQPGKIAAAAVVAGPAHGDLGCSPEGRVPLVMIGGGEGDWVDARTPRAAILPALWEFLRQYAR